MEVLKIICNAAIICVSLIAFVALIIGTTSKITSGKENNDEKTLKSHERLIWFFNITIPVMLVCAAVIILTSTLLFHPEFCLMQLFGFILSGCWLILAIFIVYMFKKM